LIKVFSGLYEIIAGDYVIDGLSIRELDRGGVKKEEYLLHFRIS
jgi:hypothetical protein